MSNFESEKIDTEKLAKSISQAFSVFHQAAINVSTVFNSEFLKKAFAELDEKYRLEAEERRWREDPLEIRERLLLPVLDIPKSALNVGLRSVIGACYFWLELLEK